MHDSLADVDRRVVGTKQVLRALDEGRISVTPLRLDQTDEPWMTRLALLFDGK